jgi:hypothetical protein
MKKLFSEFLIEQRIVSAEQMLTVVLEEVRQQTSVADFVHERHLLPPSDILKVLHHQRRSGLDFISSAKALNLWNPDISATVTRDMRARERSMVQILLDLNIVSLESLNLLLDRYTEEVSSQNEGHSSTAADAVHGPSVEAFSSKSDLAPRVPMSQVKDNVSQAAILPLKDITANSTQLDPMLVQEFVATYEERVSNQLVEMLEKFKAEIASVDQYRSLVKATCAIFATARAAANFVGAVRVASVCGDLVYCLDAVGRCHSVFQLDAIKDLVQIGSEIVGAIVQILRDVGSETVDPNDANIHDLLARFSKATDSLRSSLSEIGNAA